MKKNCSATTLKLLAIIAMTFDHAALIFIPQDNLLSYFMHLIGRLTAPIMAFFIAEGYRYTRSRKKYFLRLAAFGLISQPFYFAMIFKRFPNSLLDLVGSWNVMISLAIALLSLMILDSELPETPRLILTAVCVSLGHFSDWSLLIPVWAIIFHVFRNDFQKKAILFACASVVLQTSIFAKSYDSFIQFTYQYGTLLALIPIWKYNGQRGNVRHKKLNRWFFYAFYPTHIAALLIARAIFLD